MDAKRQEFECEQDRAAELIKTRLDDKAREVFHEKYSKLQIQASLDTLDRDIDSPPGWPKDAINVHRPRLVRGNDFKVVGELTRPRLANHGLKYRLVASALLHSMAASTFPAKINNSSLAAFRASAKAFNAI